MGGYGTVNIQKPRHFYVTVCVKIKKHQDSASSLQKLSTEKSPVFPLFFPGEYWTSRLEVIDLVVL